MYSFVDWQHFNLKTGALLREGSQSLLVPSGRIVGPGVNNHLICRLKKGETVTLEMYKLNLKAVFTPRGKLG